MDKNIKKFEKVVKLLDKNFELISIRKLTGGISAITTLVDVKISSKENKKIVVRQYPKSDINKNIAQMEFKLLNILKSLNMKVPKVYYFDDSLSIFDTGFIVMEYIDGCKKILFKDIKSYLLNSAKLLSTIHNIDLKVSDFSFLSNTSNYFLETLKKIPETYDHKLLEVDIREALYSNQEVFYSDNKVLLHGDFWPGNLLWTENKEITIIDWEDCFIGNPLFDLSNSRLEILWFFDEESMEKFTSYYLSENQLDISILPFFDLVSSLKFCNKLSSFGLDKKEEEEKIKRHNTFVKNALMQINN